MSVFSKLEKKDRRQVFSGNEFSGINLPTGDIMPDGSVLVHTKEGWNTFKMASCPNGRSAYGSASRWYCDLALRNSQRIGERAL